MSCGCCCPECTNPSNRVHCRKQSCNRRLLGGATLLPNAPMPEMSEPRMEPSELEKTLERDTQTWESIASSLAALNRAYTRTAGAAERTAGAFERMAVALETLADCVKKESER